MTDDIVTRLREHAKPKDWHTPRHPMNDWVGRWATDRLCEQAADEIERLRSELGRMTHERDTRDKSAHDG